MIDLTQCHTHTTVPVSDLARAMRWYEEKLGFRAANVSGIGALYQSGGGSTFVLYPSAAAGKGPQTVMVFMVPDLRAAVRDLRARGIVFEEYDLPGIRTIDGIADRGEVLNAWFRDGDGNILGLAQLAAP